MAEIWAAVWAGGITALGSGLRGATKGRWDSVLNTTGVTVRAKRPMRPLPRCDWIVWNVNECCVCDSHLLSIWLNYTDAVCALLDLCYWGIDTHVMICTS